MLALGSVWGAVEIMKSISVKVDKTTMDKIKGEYNYKERCNNFYCYLEIYSVAKNKTTNKSIEQWELRLPKNYTIEQRDKAITILFTNKDNAKTSVTETITTGKLEFVEVKK